MRLAVGSKPRRDLLGEEPHLAKQVVQVLGLERAERVLQARPPVLFEVLTPAPRELVATPFHDFAEVRDAHYAVWQRDWMRLAAEGTWMDQYGWKDVDEINADEVGWNLVTNRTDIMAEFPDYNAIIMCKGPFYLAVLKGGAK